MILDCFWCKYHLCEQADCTHCNRYLSMNRPQDLEVIRLLFSEEVKTDEDTINQPTES